MTNLHPNHFQMTNCYPQSKEGNVPTQISSHLETIFFDVWKPMQFEAAMPQLRTFHMDLHPPTRMQQNIARVNVWDMLCLSVMQIFISIGNHLHIWICMHKNTCLG